METGLSQQSNESGASRLWHGALGIAALAGFLLAALWVNANASRIAEPVLAYATTLLGIRTSQYVALGVLAYVLFMVPLLVIAALGVFGFLRSKDRRTQFICGTAAAFALLVDRLAGGAVDEALPRQAEDIYALLSVASWVLLVGTLAVAHSREHKRIDREAALARAEEQEGPRGD